MPVSDWEGRLEAVAGMAPPPPKDGEVVCINPTCRNEKLNRSDLNCWRCGSDRFAPASEEMRHALRFNYVAPPVLAPPPQAEEMPEGVGIPVGVLPPRPEPVQIHDTGAYEYMGAIYDSDGDGYYLDPANRNRQVDRHTDDEVSRRWRHYVKTLREMGR